MSRFSGNGSHLAEVDAAGGLAGQVGGSGGSGNAKNGSHLEVIGATEGKTVHARRNGDRHMETEASGVS